jgi:hypothetical protein
MFIQFIDCDHEEEAISMLVFIIAYSFSHHVSASSLRYPLSPPQHYVWEMDQISPVAFRICAHTFWGNKGPERIVQIGTTKCQHTSR